MSLTHIIQFLIRKIIQLIVQTRNCLKALIRISRWQFICSELRKFAVCYLLPKKVIIRSINIFIVSIDSVTLVW